LGTNSYQKLIKHNVKHTGEDGLTINNIITPGGFFFLAEYFSFNKDEFQFSIDINNDLLSNPLTFPITLYAVLYFHQPKGKICRPFILSSITQEITPSISGKNIRIQLHLNPLQQDFTRQFYNCTIYLALSYVKIESKKMVWSCTFAKEINLSLNE